MRMSHRITATLLAGAALFVVSAAPTLAQQAPANEVEALRAQVQALMARIDKLEKAPSTPAGPPASKDAPLVSADVFKAPQVTQSGNGKIKLMLSGQIGRAVQYADDGFDNDTMFVNNSQGSTRIRVAGTAKLDDNWTAGSDIEFETSSGSSRTTGFGTDAGAFSVNERKAEFWVQHKSFGRLWVGQGDTATNVTSEVDLSGTATLISHNDIGSLFGGVLFRNKANRAAGPNINTVFNNFDGLSRDDRIRYDTPTFGGGFMLSTSFIEGGATDFAGRYTGKIGTTEVSGAIGYVDNDSRTGFDTQTNGSLSVKFANGFNVTAAGGTRDIGPRDSDFWYGKLGYLANVTGLGNSSFVVDYLVQKDLAIAGGDAKAWSVGYVQTVDAFATDFYISYRNHSYDTRTTQYKDINGLISGARVRF
ncbi:porin [Niveispirillum lacus]|nr:porin [Niveispirillum lacus]